MAVAIASCSKRTLKSNLTGHTLQRFVTDLARSARFTVNTSHLTVEGRCAACQHPTPDVPDPESGIRTVRETRGAPSANTQALIRRYR